MKPLLYLLPVYALLHTAPKTTMPAHPIPTPARSFFRLGDQLVTLARYTQDHPRSYMLVSLHSNEQAAIASAIAFADARHVEFLQLMNQDKKNVEASLMDRPLHFDPAMIFTSWGRRNNLKTHGSWYRAADECVEQFARFLLNDMRQTRTIVSLHSEGQLTINDYAKGGRLDDHARELFRNAGSDAADFFMTTDEDLYYVLKQRGCNVVLQRSTHMNDDGSLNVYCAKTRRAAVTIETRPDHEAEREAMLNVLDEVLP